MAHVLPHSSSIVPAPRWSDLPGTMPRPLYLGGNNSHFPTEAETRDTLSGISMSAGSIATGGVSYSPLAKTYKTSYYLDGFPEVFSLNINYNFLIYDFSP